MGFVQVLLGIHQGSGGFLMLQWIPCLLQDVVLTGNTGHGLQCQQGPQRTKLQPSSKAAPGRVSCS